VRVLVVEPIAAEGIARLRAVHEVDERPGISREELCASLSDYDALLVRSQVQVDAEVIAAAGSRLQVVGRAGVGVDNVDLDAATAAGITVVNAPTGNTIAAAEQTLALLYGVARKIAAADASVRRGDRGGHHRGQRPDRQHERRRRAHARPPLRRRPQGGGR
jgi:D-3-phosphoglycerate dehydrogenase